MKPLISLGAAAIALAAIPIAAQWPNYPANAVPRTPDGKAVLDAPAPKAPDGHPDLSGIWALRGPGGGAGKQKGAPQEKGAPPPTPAYPD